MKKSKVRRTKRCFAPDEMATAISRAVSRDVSSLTQEYHAGSPHLSLLSSNMKRDCLKKYSTASCQDELESLTFQKFLEVNLHMEKFTEGIDFPLDSSPMRPQTRYTERDNILLGARCLMHSVLTPFLESDWFESCKHGTGTSIGVSFSDTSLEAKSIFPITMTERVVPLFDRYLEFDSMSNEALESFNQGTPIGDKYTIVEGSRATTVEKNDSIRRMIAVEPTGNMFLQQGLMSLAYARMKKVQLDVEVLPGIHKYRAKIASITSNEATIDWSSASDCVSTGLLRWLLPPLWFSCLDMVRSTHILVQDVPVKLNMFSTMGNAGTFPLETLVFWTIAQSIRLLRSGTLSVFPEWEDLLACSVFGDDCIVPSDIASCFIKTMTSVGFIINEEKSFYDDKGFRESCGGDYLHGYDVRPCFIKAPASNSLSALEPWLYVQLNSYIPKYISCFGSRNWLYDRSLFHTLVGLFRKYDLALKLVPSYFPDDAGLKLSYDIERFILCYPCKLSRITKDHHGLYTFLYCSFKYRNNEDRDAFLHYSRWLKSPVYEEADPRWLQKKRGGYIVAKGKSAHWVLPEINS